MTLADDIINATIQPLRAHTMLVKAPGHYMGIMYQAIDIQGVCRHSNKMFFYYDHGKRYQTVDLEDIQSIMPFQADEPALYRSKEQIAKIATRQLKEPLNPAYRCPGLS